MNARPEFEGKAVLITGGARNIGRELAQMFAREGAAVTINSRSARRELDQTVAMIQAAGGKAAACVADITDPQAVARMVETAAKQFGSLDILINNAITHAVKPFQELAFDDWRRTLSVALDGTFHVTQACLPHMARAGGGSIINMGGLFGHMPGSGRAATAAAKAGLAGLTRALAVEFAAHKINVNYVSPGPANTLRDEPFQFDLKRIPMGRLAEVSEIAAMVRLLCSGEGRYITGQTLHINGGLYMNS
jgi:3-oxoacyl-[acyl-carrier protein] reductase